MACGAAAVCTTLRTSFLAAVALRRGADAFFTGMCHLQRRVPPILQRAPTDVNSAEVHPFLQHVPNKPQTPKIRNSTKIEKVDRWYLHRMEKRSCQPCSPPVRSREC